MSDFYGLDIVRFRRLDKIYGRWHSPFEGLHAVMKFSVPKQTDDRLLARIAPSRRVNQQAAKFWACRAPHPEIAAKQDEVIGPAMKRERAATPGAPWRSRSPMPAYVAVLIRLAGLESVNLFPSPIDAMGVGG